MAVIEYLPTQAQHTIYGPPSPPSKWPLPNVPNTILDIIIDVVTDAAADEKSIIRPWSSDLESLSLVNRAFRRNVMERKVIDTVLLKSPKHLAKVKRQLTAEGKGYIRCLALASPDPADKHPFEISDWTPALRSFWPSLRKVKQLIDFSGEIVRVKHDLPASLTSIDVNMKDGKSLPVALQVSQLIFLNIDISDEAQNEEPTNTEPSLYTAKVQALCKNLRALGTLVLTLPGLATCMCSHSPRLKQGLDLKDPVPPGLPCLTQLHLKIPYCRPKSGNARESHWWGYLGWIAKSPARFIKLVIHMTWIPYMHLENTVPSSILIAQRMGLFPVKTPNKPHPTDKDELLPDFGLDRAMIGFCTSLLRSREDLLQIEFLYVKCTPEDKGNTIPYRQTWATKRPAGSQKDGPDIVWKDKIDHNVLASTFTDVQFLYTMGFDPPPAHEEGLEQWRHIFKLRAMGKTGLGVEITYPGTGQTVTMMT